MIFRNICYTHLLFINSFGKIKGYHPPFESFSAIKVNSNSDQTSMACDTFIDTAFFFFLETFRNEETS